MVAIRLQWEDESMTPRAQAAALARSRLTEQEARAFADSINCESEEESV